MKIRIDSANLHIGGSSIPVTGHELTSAATGNWGCVLTFHVEPINSQPLGSAWKALDADASLATYPASTKFDYGERKLRSEYATGVAFDYGRRVGFDYAGRQVALDYAPGVRFDYAARRVKSDYGAHLVAFDYAGRQVALDYAPGARFDYAARRVKSDYGARLVAFDYAGVRSDYASHKLAFDYSSRAPFDYGGRKVQSDYVSAASPVRATFDYAGARRSVATSSGHRQIVIRGSAEGKTVVVHFKGIYRCEIDDEEGGTCAVRLRSSLPIERALRVIQAWV
jgi:hypothetical protein